MGSYYSQYGDGYVPYTVVIGRDRKLYFSMSGYDDDACRAAIDQAIADYGGLVYVANPISDKLFGFNDSEILDVSTVFDQYEPEIVNVTILNNSNPSAVTASMSKANTLNLTASSSNAGQAIITLEGRDIDNNTATTEISVTVYDADPQYTNIEDFEDGNFTGTYTWILSSLGQGARDWTVATTSPYEGTYCAESGSIRDDGSTTIELDLTYTLDGLIGFQQKTSSELDWDWLIFYIDDVEQGKLSGVTAWEQAIYDVAAGAHNFKWVYIKDSNTDGGTDQAWVDYIQFIELPPQANLTAPANVVTTADAANVTITWDAVAGATSYVVYSSVDPYGTFAIDNSGTFNGEEWSSSLVTKNFYYVIATNAKSKIPQTIEVKSPKIKVKKSLVE
ncbi:MAG: hypothetical protein GQ534_08705 [Candidatus Delongbacteria bacterium]|nr:hypothetical protein [Candidatus Delongbacteria bacterium]